MKVKKFACGLLALLVIALMMAPSLLAQTLTSGALAGTVTDPSGAVVPKATVTLKSNATGATRTTTSNAAGAYRFSLLQPGSYTITVTAQGFTKAQTSTSINVGQATVADVKLAVGASSQTVEVTSAAPLINTENAELTTNMSQTIVANEPNGGNDLTYIAQTAPGVNMNTGMGYGNFNTAGLPATSNVFTMNGENQMDPYLNLNNSGATNLMLGKNSVQEASVVTNAYGGQYGQQAGVQVNYVTKSGSNAYHGNLEYWWTGSAVDANAWYNGAALNNGVAQPTPFNNNNQWAASLGGPIKKNKLFFFVDTEGIRYIVPTTTTVYVPTPLFAQQTLANMATVDPGSLGLYNKMFNLYSGAKGNPNINSSSLPAGGCLDMAGTPLATGGGVFGAGNPCFNSFTGSPSEPATEWLLTGRIDYNLSDKDHLFWNVSADHGTQATYADPINSAFSAASYQPQYNGQGQWTHTFGSNATNQLVYAGSYYRAIFTQNDAAGTFPAWYDMNAVLGYTSMGNIESAFPQGRNATQYQFVDDFSWTKGAHTFKFGANFRRYDITDYVFSQFSPAFGSGPLALPFALSDVYNGSAGEFISSYPNSGTEPVALWGLGLYAQDEWRVSKSLKLTFAMRAEHNSNPTCNTNCASYLSGPFSTVSTNPATPYNQMVTANQGSVFPGVDTIDWAPRFGFAWSPGGSDKTVVSGGFGIFYDAFPAVLGDNLMNNLPNSVSINQGYAFTGAPTYWANQTAPTSPWIVGQNTGNLIHNGFANGASYNTLSSSVPPGLFPSPSINSMPGQFHTPRYQEWNLSIEQQLDDKSSATLSYIGNHGVDETVENFANAFGGGIGGFPTSAYSPLNFGQVNEIYSGAVSNDNQLTASYQRRMTYGFTISASYTWAHAMDEISNTGLGAEPYASLSAPYQFNPTNLRDNYGNADYDIGSYFNAQYVWQTPWKFSNKFVDGAFGGWTISQNFFARTGLPLTVMDGTTSSLLGNFNGDPIPANVIGSGQAGCTNGFSRCFNSGAFAPVGAAYPNQMRNQFRGPGFFDSDLSFNKNFKITERVAFGLGANMYNVFNHPNFALPGNVYGAGNFGVIGAQTAPPTGPFGSFFAGLPANRIIQFQGKIVF